MRLRRLLVLAASVSAATMTTAFGSGAGAEVSVTGSSSEIDEIVVQATPLGHTANDVATPIAQLSGDDLVHRRRPTLGETLQSLPGVNADTFGGGASRPVIRGQPAPRVKVLSDSSELMDASAVSPDHAVAAEPLLLEKIEVLRGPSALLYGGGAIAGAVNLIDTKIPTRTPDRGLEGVVEARFGTNARERAGVFGVTAATGAFALRLEGVRRSSDDYEVPHRTPARVAGAYLDSSTVTLGGAWLGEKGYLGAAFTRQKSTYGLAGHNHEYEGCHPHGLTLHCGGHDDEHQHDEAGHEHQDEEAPSVRLRSDRWDIRGETSQPLPGVERVRLRAGFTDYRHDEIDDGEIATTFLNKGYDGRLEVEHSPFGGWRGVLGVQVARSDFSAIGIESFLPASDTGSAGLFLFEEQDVGDWHFELAARKDWQRIKGDDIGSARHSPFSASASAVWSFIPGYSLAVAVSRARRAPTAQELHADGVHLATSTYELGDAGLRAETARTIDLTLRKTKGATTFTLGVFRHRIDSYIYAETLDQFEGFRLIRYTQRDARFEGLDGEMTRRFTHQISGTVFGDYVRAKLVDGGGNLPRIPAGRLGGRVNGAWGALSGEFEYYRVFEQSKVAAHEAATSGYDMVNATLAYDIEPGGRMQIYARGTNLLDRFALNHVSFISRAAPLPGRTVVLGVRGAF